MVALQLTPRHILPNATGAGPRATDGAVRTRVGGRRQAGALAPTGDLAVFTRKETQTFLAPRVLDQLPLPASLSSCKQDVQLCPLSAQVRV